MRQLKQSGAQKSEWEPYVKTLLEMKKSLEQMKLDSNPISIDDLEEEISKQVIAILHSYLGLFINMCYTIKLTLIQN